MNIYLNNDNYDLDEILEKNQTEETEKILQKLWKDSQESNQIVLSYYGRVLRKLDKQIEFIDICRKFIRNGREITNKYVLSCLCWCIYDYYIQSYESNDKECLEKFIKEAKYIKDNCEQKEDYSNPYVLTVMKVLKIYNKGNMRNKKNLNAILEWISYLNPEKLSEKVFKYKDKNGEEREKASEKELYYQYKVKALEKLEQYDECIEACKIALDVIKKFHYRNETWIKARLYYCNCMIQDDIDKAIREYKELAYEENYWFMFHKLSKICFINGKVEDSLLYANKAIVTDYEYEKMINLFLDVAWNWEAIGEKEIAKKFFQASAYYRDREGWTVPEELRYKIKEENINIKSEPNKKELIDIAKQYVYKIEGRKQKYIGIIKRILPNGYSGFIKQKNLKKDIYFRKNNIKNKKIFKEGTKVTYEIIECDNGKIEAVEIEGVEYHGRNKY